MGRHAVLQVILRVELVTRGCSFRGKVSAQVGVVQTRSRPSRSLSDGCRPHAALGVSRVSIQALNPPDHTSQEEKHDTIRSPCHNDAISNLRVAHKFGEVSTGPVRV